MTNCDIHLFKTRDGKWRARVETGASRGIYGDLGCLINLLNHVGASLVNDYQFGVCTCATDEAPDGTWSSDDYERYEREPSGDVFDVTPL